MRLHAAQRSYTPIGQSLGIGVLTLMGRSYGVGVLTPMGRSFGVSPGRDYSGLYTLQSELNNVLYESQLMKLLTYYSLLSSSSLAGTAWTLRWMDCIL
jgi:hypothetical protein